MREKVVISVGGSIIVPEEVDTEFLRRFRDLVLSLKSRKQFFLICGGGKVCRKYQAAARELGVKNPLDVDWVGIATTRLNAELVRAVFGKEAHERVIIDNKPPRTQKIVLFGGNLPGHSTDKDAVEVAKRTGAKTVVNLTNVDYVYTADPKKDPGAKPLVRAGWKEVRKIIGNKWTPGLNAVFDPVAARDAEKLGLRVVFLRGANIENLSNFLHGEKFVGSVIE